MGKPFFIPNPRARLQEQVAEVCRFRHFSLRTQEAYWHWIKRFILHHGKRHPREMGGPEVAAFLSHVAQRSPDACRREAIRDHRVVWQ